MDVQKINDNLSQGLSVESGVLYNRSVYSDESLGEFEEGKFVPSVFLLQLAPAIHKIIDKWAMNWLKQQ